MTITLAKPPLLGHHGAIYTIAETPDTDTFWTAGSDGMVAEWSPNKSTDAQLRATVHDTILCVAYFGQIMAVGAMNGAMYFIDLTTKTEIKSVLHHQKGVFDLRFVNGALWSVGGDARLTRWDISTLLPIETLRLGTKNLRGFDVFGRIFAVASSESHIYIVNTETHTKVEKIIETAHTPSVFVCRLSPCGKYLWSGGRDALLKIWDVNDDFSLHHVIPAHSFTINDIRFSPCGKYVATASRDKTIKIWSAESFQLLKVIDAEKGGHRNSVNRILWLNDTQFCSVSDDASARIFNISSF